MSRAMEILWILWRNFLFVCLLNGCPRDTAVIGTRAMPNKAKARITHSADHTHHTHCERGLLELHTGSATGGDEDNVPKSKVGKTGWKRSAVDSQS